MTYCVLATEAVGISPSIEEEVVFVASHSPDLNLETGKICMFRQTLLIYVIFPKLLGSHRSITL